MLESRLQASEKDSQKNKTALGLKSVQEHLMFGEGYLEFEEVYHMYTSFNRLSCSDKQGFRDKILDPSQGLPVYLATHPITSI